MALAILDVVGWEKGGVRFGIDTGTNPYYQLKVGRAVQRRSGVDWVDRVYFSSPLRRSEAGGRLLGSSAEISLPTSTFEEDDAYVQLLSFKNPAGKSPAFSRVVRIPVGRGLARGAPDVYQAPLALAESVTMDHETFQPARRVPCRSPVELYARATGLEDLLMGAVRAAAPVVLNLLGGAGAPGASGTSGTGGAGAQPGGAAGDALMQLLRTILGSLAGQPTQATSHSQSLVNGGAAGNRFVTPQAAYARPFIFGIDDAVFGALIGNVVQVLPQLMNAANQARLQNKEANNRLITGLMSDVNRRLMLQQLLQAQQSGSGAAASPDLANLVSLLQQAGPTAGTAPAQPEIPTAPVATQSSLDMSHLSRGCVVTFEPAQRPTSDGEPLMFDRRHPLELRIKLNAREPAPRAPLSRAIVTLTFKDRQDQTVRLQKTFQQKDIRAGEVMAYTFGPDEVARLPVQRCLCAFAEVRWLTSRGDERKAVGTMELMIVGQYRFKEQGAEVGEERELVDMKRFRPFWNKVWETPSLEGSNGEGRAYLWELDVTARYSVLLSPDHSTNGLMETKLASTPAEQSVTRRTEGRLKAGIELSLDELNKLLSLWELPPLEPEKLEALRSQALARANGSEVICNLRLKGRARERGMIWVVPVFRLVRLTVAAVASTDDTGQVTGWSEEKVSFPLPVSLRVLGLKTKP
jgi:hypothetical protein